jgi:hypothetical protein
MVRMTTIKTGDDDVRLKTGDNDVRQQLSMHNLGTMT